MWLSIFSTISSKNKYYMKKTQKCTFKTAMTSLCHLKHEDISWLSALPTQTLSSFLPRRESNIFTFLIFAYFVFFIVITLIAFLSDFTTQLTNRSQTVVPSHSSTFSTHSFRKSVKIFIISTFHSICCVNRTEHDNVLALTDCFFINNLCPLYRKYNSILISY